MVRAGALYYAVFLVFILSSLVGFFVIQFYLDNYSIQKLSKQEDAINDVLSAIAILEEQPAYFAINYGEKKECFLMNEDSPKIINIFKHHWGFYDYFLISAKRDYFQYRKALLMGIKPKEKLALYMTDAEKFLSLSGNALLKGKCYLPKLGIKRTSIQGRSYSRNKLIYGEQSNSGNQLPNLAPSKLHYLSNCTQEVFDQSDSITFSSEIKENKLTNSFFNKTLIILHEDENVLPFHRLRGNIAIISKTPITIQNNQYFSDIIIIAPSITIEKNVQLQCQLIAKENINVKEGVQMNYPSSLAIYSTKSNQTLNLSIGSNANIEGIVFAYNEERANEKSRLNIGERAEIRGEVFTNIPVNHKGLISGSITCNKFVLDIRGSYYENVILDGKINRILLDKTYIGGTYIANKSKYGLIKWLEE